MILFNRRNNITPMNFSTWCALGIAAFILYGENRDDLRLGQRIS